METIEDIISEMRDWDRHSYVDGNAHELLVEFADRIEVAAQKLKNETRCFPNMALRCTTTRIRSGASHSLYARRSKRRSGKMETVEDIIKEIRQIAHNISVADEKTLSMFRPVAALARISNRIDAAYKRDMQSMVEAGERDMRTAMDEVARLCAALYSDEDFGKLLKDRDTYIVELLKKVKDEECTDF